MDRESFDDVTRTLIEHQGTRRAVLRLLAGGLLGSVAARVGSAENAEAKRKRDHRSSGTNERKRGSGKGQGGVLQAQGKHNKQRHRKRGKDKPKPEPCPEGQGRCPDGTCLPWDACCPDAPVPLCNACQDEVCEAGELVCRSRCVYSDSVCCKGECVLPCSNGCQTGDDCSRCDSPPAGMAYCASQDQCVSTTCPQGKDFDAASCQCKDHCPAVISVACPPVPAHSDWKGIFGDEFPLPEGCCGLRYWWEDSSGAWCATPGHHVPSQVYRCNG